MGTAQKKVEVKNKSSGKSKKAKGSGRKAAKSATAATDKSAQGTKKGRAIAPKGDSPLAALREEIDHVFEKFTHNWPSFRNLSDWDPFKDLHLPASLNRSALSPKVDIQESDGTYTLTAELPGLGEDDIELTVTDNMLVLKGEKRNESESEEDNMHVTERSYGSFRRSFRMPGGIDANQAKADFDKGVLTVSIPKKAKEKSNQRKVPVQTR